MECKMKVKKHKFPYEIVDVDSKTNSQLLEDFTGEKSTFVQVGPEKWFFPSGYKGQAENYYNFKVRPDDIWVVTFPRSGTTWTQEMVWLLGNNLDYKKAAENQLTERFPFIEFSFLFHPEMVKQFYDYNKSHESQVLVDSAVKPGWKVLEEVKGRRFIKTHLPLDLLPPDLLTCGCKVIYVARNPKDVAVSYYYLHGLFNVLGFKKDFAKFWDYFEKDLVMWAPFWKHLQSGWDKRQEKNLLFMFYEDLNHDLKQSIGKVADFLGTKYSDEEFEVLRQHLSFENFKNNTSVAFKGFDEAGITNSKEGFVRKGQTGGSKEVFVGALKERADRWIAENLRNTDMRFPEY